MTDNKDARIHRVGASLAKQLRLSIERNAKLETEVTRLRAGVDAIKAATVAGRVCDDVAWFDDITTLHDYCEHRVEGH